jgi:hypothetical protein
MRERYAFDYAVIRLVPRVERGECVNIGVVLLCRQCGYLGMRLAPDPARIQALWPDVDIEVIDRQLDGLRQVCDGDPSGGPIAQLSQAERFHWIVSPASTVIQPSPVHSGLCDDPEDALDTLMAEMVFPPQSQTGD